MLTLVESASSAYIARSELVASLKAMPRDASYLMRFREAVSEYQSTIAAVPESLREIGIEAARADAWLSLYCTIFDRRKKRVVRFPEAVSASYEAARCLEGGLRGWS